MGFPVGEVAEGPGAPSPENLAMLKDMGFPEDECRRALAAALNDPDRAVQYLMEGFPEGASQMAEHVESTDKGVEPEGSTGMGEDDELARAMAARAAKLIAPTNMGRPALPWTSVSPVSAW